LLSYILFEGRPLTTRGRWINPLLFVFFAIEKILPALRQVRQPIFILGIGRSGTTVLGIALSMHKSVGFLNEPKALWHAIHPGEDLVGNYTRAPAQYRLTMQDATQDRVRHAHRLMGDYLAASFSTRVVDKYPELIFRVPFVKEIFPDSKYIFLIRNGWDTCRSIEGWSGRLGIQANGEVHDWWGVNRRKWNLLVEQLVPEHADLAPHQAEIAEFVRQRDMAAVEWIVTMREGMRLLESNPTHVIGVRFEELCRQPERVLSELRKFLGLEEDKVFLAYGERIFHPISEEGPYELHSLIEKPFNETMALLGYA